MLSPPPETRGCSKWYLVVLIGSIAIQACSGFAVGCRDSTGLVAVCSVAIENREEKSVVVVSSGSGSGRLVDGRC